MAGLNPNVPGSEGKAQGLAPLAQPETSDSAMDTTSSDSASIDSHEKTTSGSQSQEMESANEPISEKSSLTSFTLAQDTASVCSDKGQLPEDDNGPPTHVETKQMTEKFDLDSKSGPSTMDRSKLQSSADEFFLAEDGPSVSKDGSSTDSQELFTPVTSLSSLVQRRHPSASSSQEFASVESKTPEPENDENRLISDQPRDEEPADQPRPNLECCTLRYYIVRFLRCWQSYSLYVTDSIFLLPIQVILAALSLTATVVGFVFMNDCPVAPELPIYFLTLGYLGLLSSCLRIAFVCYNFRSVLRRCIAAQRKLIIMVNIAFLFLFAVELYTFFSMNPTFTPDLEDYCSALFNTIAYVLNCIVIILVFVMFSIHFPAYIFYSFGVGGPGFDQNA